jgi:hypothetical protein
VGDESVGICDVLRKKSAAISNCGVGTIRVFNGSDFYPQFLPLFPHLINFVGLLRHFLAFLGLDDIFTRRIFVNSRLKLLDATKGGSERNCTVRFLPKEQNRDRIENMEHAEAFNRLRIERRRMIQRIDRDLLVGQKTGKRVVR